MMANSDSRLTLEHKSPFKVATEPNNNDKILKSKIVKWVRLLKKRHKSYKDLIVRVNFSKNFASVNLGNIGVSLVKTPPRP